MFELHQSIHDQYGLCLWTILTIVVFLIFVILWVLHIIRQNRRQKAFDREQAKVREAKAKAGGQEV